MKKSTLPKTVCLNSKLSKEQMNNITGGGIIHCSCEPSMPNCGYYRCPGYHVNKNDDCY